MHRRIERTRQRTANPDPSLGPNDAFIFDLNGDGRQEYFVRLTNVARPAIARGAYFQIDLRDCAAPLRLGSSTFIDAAAHGIH